MVSATTSLREAAQLFEGRHVTLRGRRYHYRQANPEGTHTIVVVHGVTGTGYSMLRMAVTWADRGYRVLLPDLPGHGHSDNLPLERLEGLAEWLDDFLRETTQDGPVTLVGNSFGSMVIYIYAAQYRVPNQMRIVLGAPTPMISASSRILFRLSKLVPLPLARRLFYNPFADFIRVWGYMGDVRNRYNRKLLWEALSQESPLVRHRYAQDLITLQHRERPFYTYELPADVLARTAVVTGRRDIIAGRRTKREMERLMPGARILHPPRSGHFVHIEALEAMDEAVWGHGK